MRCRITLSLLSLLTTCLMFGQSSPPSPATVELSYAVHRPCDIIPLISAWPSWANGQCPYQNDSVFVFARPSDPAATHVHLELIYLDSSGNHLTASELSEIGPYGSAVAVFAVPRTSVLYMVKARAVIMVGRGVMWVPSQQ